MVLACLTSCSILNTSASKGDSSNKGRALTHCSNWSSRLSLIKESSKKDDRGLAGFLSWQARWTRRHVVQHHIENFYLHGTNYCVAKGIQPVQQASETQMLSTNVSLTMWICLATAAARQGLAFFLLVLNHAHAVFCA